jgi:hypothetical protein
MKMKIEIGNEVLVDLRYEGMTWLVVTEQVDAWGEFVAMGAEGVEHVLHVEKVQAIKI